MKKNSIIALFALLFVALASLSCGHRYKIVAEKVPEIWIVGDTSILTIWGGNSSTGYYIDSERFNKTEFEAANRAGVTKDGFDFELGDINGKKDVLTNAIYVIENHMAKRVDDQVFTYNGKTLSRYLVIHPTLYVKMVSDEEFADMDISKKDREKITAEPGVFIVKAAW